MAEYRQGWASRAAEEPNDEIIKSGVNPDNIRKWKVLQSVQDRNETLFYKLLMDNFREMAPIIHQPSSQYMCNHPHYCIVLYLCCILLMLYTAQYNKVQYSTVQTSGVLYCNVTTSCGVT